MIRTPVVAGHCANRDQEAFIVQDLPNARLHAPAEAKGGLDGSAAYATPTYLAASEGACFANDDRTSFMAQESMASMISFNSSSDDGPEPLQPCDVPGAKVDALYSLLSLLSSHDRLQSSQVLLNMSQDKENCQLLRGSGCLSLLVQLLHPIDVMPLPDDIEIVRQASEALRNIVLYDEDDARRNRDCVVLSLSEHVRKYVLHLRALMVAAVPYGPKYFESASEAMATLVQLSFSEEQRRAMCALGALHCIAEALVLDEKVFGSDCSPLNRDFRRLIAMALTNLTYGASETKRVLCANNNFLRAVNAQIRSQPEESKQMFACVLRNLSWKTNPDSKTALKEAGTVEILMRAAMEVERETTLKSILSALWNLSYHCSENKARICGVPSALEFLVKTLAYKSPTGSVAVAESCGGILRNISSHVALKEEYRAVLRQHNCFKILLEHLESPSLTIVSNACGTLWNLSAHNADDQRTLRQMGAEKKLRDLVHSKHKIISLGSAATLKNLLIHRSREDGGSMNVSSTNTRPGSNFRQQRMQMEKGPDEGALHHSISVDKPSSLTSSHRHPTAAMEIAAMLNDVTRPSVIKSSTPPFRIPATPPMKEAERQGKTIGEGMGYSRSPAGHQLGMSASYSSPSSKEERVYLDKAAVHRFHSSIRRTGQPMDGQSVFTTSAYGSSAVHSDGSFSGYREPTASCFADTAVSVPSARRLSPEKSKPEVAQSLRVECPPHQQRAWRKLSGTTTPAEFKSEPSSRGSKSVSAVTPLMFSRQSSMDSLDSCEQHSVRSTVYSEYSQLPTGLPSPSELPDSPTGTLPVREKKGKEMAQQCGPVDGKIPGEPTAFDPTLSATAPPPAASYNISRQAESQESKEQTNRVTTIENDDEEKPKVYGKGNANEAGARSGGDLWKDRQQEYEGSELSAWSSISSLTISDINPEYVDRLVGQNENLRRVLEECGIRGFGPGGSEQQSSGKEQQRKSANICRELQDCILSARPAPKATDSGSKGHRAGANAFAKTHSINGNSVTPATKQEPMTDISDRGVDKDGEADLRFVMQSAMPKPKQPHQKSTNHSGPRIISPRGTKNSNIGIAKPMLRSLASPDPPLEQTRVPPVGCESNQKSGTVSHSQRGASAPNRNTPANGDSQNVMEKSEEVLQCIAMAMPKPKPSRKSKSLDRRAQKRDFSLSVANSTGRSRGPAADLSVASCTTSSSGAVESSCDQENAKSLLFLSSSSALMNSAATAERVKDATVLFDSSNPVGIPVARIAPEPKNNQKPFYSNNPPGAGRVPEMDENNVFESQKGDQHIIVRNDDSLSEDNYSHILDDSFSVKLEDIDIDSMKDGDWEVLSSVNPLEGLADCPQTGVEFPSPTELLIDCDVFSSASYKGSGENNSTFTSGGPKILRGPPPSVETKPVRGGQRWSQTHPVSTAAAPKMAVRTTKASELRAKKLQNTSSKFPPHGLGTPESGNPRSRSMSPAMNPGVASWPARRPAAKSAPSSRLRHHSSCSAQQYEGRPLSVAVTGRIENEPMMRQSPRRQQSESGQSSSKIRMGANVKRKIELLQKGGSGPEQNAAAVPTCRVKSAAGTNDKRGAVKL